MRQMVLRIISQVYVHPFVYVPLRYGISYYYEPFMEVQIHTIYKSIAPVTRSNLWTFLKCTFAQICIKETQCIVLRLHLSYCFYLFCMHPSVCKYVCVYMTMAACSLNLDSCISRRLLQQRAVYDAAAAGVPLSVCSTISISLRRLHIVSVCFSQKKALNED